MAEVVAGFAVIVPVAFVLMLAIAVVAYMPNDVAVLVSWVAIVPKDVVAAEIDAVAGVVIVRKIAVVAVGGIVAYIPKVAAAVVVGIVRLGMANFSFSGPLVVASAPP